VIIFHRNTQVLRAGFGIFVQNSLFRAKPSLVETNRQIAPWPWRLGMLSLDNFSSHSLYPPSS